MTDASHRSSQQPRTGMRLAHPASCAVAALLAAAVWAAPAAAGPKEQAAPTDDHYQVYIGGRDDSTYMLNQGWGELRLSAPNAGGALSTPALSGSADGTGVTYFTPSVSGVRVGAGFGATPAAKAPDTANATSGQYTDLGPRTTQGRGAAGHWQLGGTVAYSALELGTNIGDHTDPTCTGGGCKTNDFWDVGVALRIGSGAISAGYTASHPRGPRPDDADRIDIYSLNAGYNVTPGLGIFGGVDWVDTRSQSETQETPVDTRFMLGTNLKF
jgi:Gram-negative porin